ncbi:hypothetical protein [uncultured Proteiniphilum sp.]|uniref:hypothetical protein n=1 Tax=uncultured Proteiniphilum sp. TaxID=497637 RepID=UPI00260CC2E7|nr:hypothetical protein [uncultured Proteiniphilum sp.]
MKNVSGYINIIIFFLGFYSLFCFYSCSNEEIEIGVTEKEHYLNLISPSGEKIADNIADLKNETALIVAEAYGIDKAFEITKLDYLPSEKGYIVFIEYKTEDGLNGSYVMSKNVKINYSQDNVILKSSNCRLKSGSEDGGGGSTKFVCKPHGNCSSCILQGSYDPNTGEHTITCSCSECKMEITIS